MTFEDFEKAHKRELRARAKECFEKAQEGGAYFNTDMQSTAFLEAQFYMSEIERRSTGRVALRDLLLEIMVILLIGGEIWLAVKQGKDEDVLMGKQNSILASLQSSTADNGKSIGALATVIQTMSDSTAESGKTLASLRATTETMNKAVHDQVDLFYDPSINLTYSSDPSRVLFTNTGKSALTLIGVEVDGAVAQLGGPKLIMGTTNYYVEYPTLYKDMATKLPKGVARSMPVTATFKNEQGRTFLLTGALFWVWDGDKLAVHSQPSSLVPKP